MTYGSPGPGVQEPVPAPPGRGEDGGRGGSGDGYGTVAWVILASVVLVIIAAVVLGLSFDLGDSSDDGVGIKYKLKIIALSSQFFGFFSATVAPSLILAVALLVAISLARGSSAQSSVATAAMVVAGLLALLTVVALVTDLTLFSDLDDEDSGTAALVGVVITDLASLCASGAAVALGRRAARD